MPEIVGPNTLRAVDAAGGDPILSAFHVIDGLASDNPAITRRLVKIGEKKGAQTALVYLGSIAALGPIKGFLFGTFVVEGFVSPGHDKAKRYPSIQQTIGPGETDESQQIPGVQVTEQWRADP